jgi:putative NADPH-quinone reductase
MLVGMETRRILLIQGHPDPAGGHLCHAIADAYAEGGGRGGHSLRRLEVGRLDFPLLRRGADWQDGAVPPALEPAQQDIVWAEHLVLVFPLWLGDMPALLKGFLEQVARPGFAFARDPAERGAFGAKALGGRSARVIVTMGMPAMAYRYLYRAHSVKSLERNILGSVGIAPVHETMIGSVESLDDRARGRWFARLRKLGAHAG